MSGESEDNLERELAQLTRWEGGDVQAWRAALASDKSTRDFGLARKLWNRKLSRWAWTAVAATVVFVSAVPFLYSLGSSTVAGRVRFASRAPSELARKIATDRAPASADFKYSHVTDGSFGRAGPGIAPESTDVPNEGLMGYVGADRLGTPFSPGVGQFISPSAGDAGNSARNEGRIGPVVLSNDNTEDFSSHYYVSNIGENKAEVSALVPRSDRTSPAAERYVIRKANIELRTTDVRAAFLKASHLVSEAHGEYVQESSLTGSDQRLQANLTIRVAADRLSSVLQALRELGTVRAETAGGEDVTTQVVDMEARLSNEKRVEVELLQLMEKRTDGPLKEVLELRSAIGNVRQTIETLTAQRERLARLVSLATILVIIRSADTAAEPASPGLWDYFTTAVSRAAERGVQALINTVAGLILVLVGGALWFALLAAGVLIAIRIVKTRPQQMRNQG